MGREYQVCSRCVMDTTDPDISFDSGGICSHCIHFRDFIRPYWHPGPDGRAQLERMFASACEEGRGKEYDCIIGLSGGVDSSYLTLKIKEFGLRPLCVHVDAGWNSEIAVGNIERIVNYCGFELFTHVIDWEEIRDLQLAYLRARVANQDVPQDHAFFAALFHFAVKNGIRTVLSGGNIATEAIFPRAWHASAMDSINLRAIHKRYGTGRLRNYPSVNFWQYYVWYPFARRMKVLHPLNYLPYDKAAAMVELQRVGWRPYGRKHGESLFTKFFQNYYLPTLFGFDKRRPHLSSLIVSGQISRDEALEALREPLYAPDELEADLGYFAKKLGISRRELDDLLALPRAHYSEFRNWDRRYAIMKQLQRFLHRLTGYDLKSYW